MYVGACCAIAMHSSITSRSTGRVRSSRLRTALVVVSNSGRYRRLHVNSLSLLIYASSLNFSIVSDSSASVCCSCKKGL